MVPFETDIHYGVVAYQRLATMWDSITKFVGMNGL